MKPIIPLLIVLTAFACNKSKKIIELKPSETTVESTVTHDQPGTSAQEEKHIGEVKIIEDYDLDSTGMNYSIREISAKKNIVTATVQYGGGCKEHQFSLIHNEIMLESEPPQLYATLLHESEPDPCRAMPVEVWHFDISKLGNYTQGKFILFIQEGEKIHRLEIDLNAEKPQIKR